MANVSYTPTFQHEEWVDNVDRVMAGGTNGFNIRFNTIETEFQEISQVVNQIDTALDNLGQAPPPQTVVMTFTPTLVSIAAGGWTHGLGLAQKPSGATSAQGMMHVDLPHGATLRTFTAVGKNEGTTPGTNGAGDLRIILRRQEIATEATGSTPVARVDGSTNPFNSTVNADPTVAQVDTNRFKYFVTAQLNNAGANDTVLLMAFQISYSIA